MPKISERGIEMPSSPIRKLAPLANEAKARGVKVYHLNIGQPDLPTPQKALDALKHVDRKVLEYSPSQGFLSLREKLQAYYRKFRIELSVNDISLPAEALKLCCLRSWLVLIPGMKSLSRSRLMPIIWLLQFLQVQ